MQEEANVLLVRVDVEMSIAAGVERRRAALDAVHDVSLGKKQFGQIGAVLTGYAGDERYFRHVMIS